MNRKTGRHCRLCGALTLARDKHGSVCRTCKPARVPVAKRPPPPRPAPVDLAASYRPGSVPSPFLFEQLRKEARRAVPNRPGDDDLIQYQSWKRRVFAVFVRRCTELGIPLEGA